MTGGTGVVGRAVVTRLLESGHRVRIASRHERPPGDTRGWSVVDYGTGSGLVDAMADVDAVVHCAFSPQPPLPCANPKTGRGIEGPLVDAARAVGGPHLVYISIVGIDRVPYGYYRAKLTGERIVTTSGLPWTLLRTTQFHDLVGAILRRLSTSPVLFTPDIPVQPIDVREVGARLADLACGPPAGRVPDLGGPEVRMAPDLARSYLDATRRRRVVAPVRVPGKAFRQLRDGALVTPDHATETRTFEEYLREEGRR